MTRGPSSWSARSSWSAEAMSTKPPTICPPSKPTSIRTRSLATGHHLRENTVNRFRMHERDREPEHPAARLRVDQLGTGRREICEGGTDVVHLVGDMVHSRAALREKPAHGRVVTERREQLDPSLTNAHRRGFH